MAYPLGMRGVVVGQGNTADDAVLDVVSAIRFHLDSFGQDALDRDAPVLEAYVTEARLIAG